MPVGTDELRAELKRQKEMSDATAETFGEEAAFDIYLRNIGLDKDAVMEVAAEYARNNIQGITLQMLRDMLQGKMSGHDDPRRMLFDTMCEVGMLGFIRGLSLGMVLGREHPV